MGRQTSAVKKRLTSSETNKNSEKKVLDGTLISEMIKALANAFRQENVYSAYNNRLATPPSPKGNF